MANPLYHDDPDWYERPGQTVNLHVDANPAKHVVPALPWMGGESMADRVQRSLVGAAVRDYTNSGYTCVVCSRPTRSVEHLTCPYCARAQQRDETAHARAKQPTPTHPRISVREAWESWAESQPATDDGYADGHVRSYETRIA